MERLFNTLILLILSIYCHSQIEISTPKIIPTSPNAASLGILEIFLLVIIQVSQISLYHYIRLNWMGWKFLSV